MHKNPSDFRILADSEADKELDNPSIGYKTTNVYKQNPLLDGFYIVSELDKLLKNGFFQSPSGYNNVDWVVNEVIWLENEMHFFFKNTNQDITLTWWNIGFQLMNHAILTSHKNKVVLVQNSLTSSIFMKKDSWKKEW